MTLWVLSGCAASVIGLYDETRATAMAELPPLAADWKPHAGVRLSWPVVNDAVDASVAAAGAWGTALSLGPVKIEPAFDVSSVDVSRGSCPGCIRLHAKLAGTVHWSALVAKGTVPATAELDFDVEATAEGQADGELALRIAPKAVHKASAKVGGSIALLDTAGSAIADWMVNSVVSRIPPFEIARFGAAELPIRAARLRSDGNALGIELALQARTGTVELGNGPCDGFALRLATSTLVELARISAFDQGPLDFDVVPEPTGLEVDGDRFRLDLRLWRLAGKGWWRDVRIEGALRLQNQRLHLDPESVEEVDHSRGAGLVDPIAVLLRGTILRTIEDAVTHTLPAVGRERVSGVKAVARVDSIDGLGDALEVSGTLSFQETRSAEARQRDPR